MKKLIDVNKKQYKANLHAHSTCSDGRLSPEQMKEAYKEQGYSVLAITDHENLVEHHELSDVDFVCITAYEMFVFTLPSDHNCNCVAHLNLYSKTPHNKLLYYSPEFVYSRYNHGEEREIEYYYRKETREHTIAFVQNAVRDAIEKGFLVSHCHPSWSFEDETFADAFKDCFAMEVFNYSSYMSGFFEYNQRYYDFQSNHGKRMAVLAVDDNHNFVPIGHPNSDSFGGFTYILADELSYESVIGALETGNCYASCGPQIFGLTVEQGVLQVRTSSVQRICFITNTRNRKVVMAKENESVSMADFAVGETDAWVRIEVVDDRGRYAFTRAYDRKELFD